MELLTSAQLFHILQRTLNHVDPRLMGHGERVAVVMHQMLKKRLVCDPHEISRLCLLGLLHDIGAYKTEEIDDMMGFESAGVWEHSAYGYLFLKKLSPLGDAALPLLYHHLPYFRYNTAEVKLREDDYAGLIYLADRADIITAQRGAQFCRNWVQENRGNLFCPEWVDLLLAADDEAGILAHLENGTHGPALADMIDTLDIDEDEIGRYLSVIAYAVDFRSEFMVLHTVTTVSVSQVLGEKIGLSPEEQISLYYGALLHDIGKVATPVEILEKPGKLTPDEMSIMKRHVVLTREILNGFIDPVVLEIGARHHEKLDGTGYPQGLTGDQLTCPERICAVADIVSALIRQRSYKSAFDKTMTLSILTKMRDSGQICPAVTNLVLENFDEIVVAAERFGERITNAYTSIRQSYVSLLARLPFTT